eukprot:4669367-Pyramimonas_sp.AAC.1
MVYGMCTRNNHLALPTCVPHRGCCSVRLTGMVGCVARLRVGNQSSGGERVLIRGTDIPPE